MPGYSDQDRFRSRPFSFIFYDSPCHSALYNLSCWNYKKLKQLTRTITALCEPFFLVKCYSTFLFRAPRFMKERYFFGGSQASPVRPSGKSNVYMKTSMRHLWNSCRDVSIKTKPLNVLWVNNMCILWDLYRTHDYTVLAERRIFVR
jgi:hypothetical protein